MGWDGMGWDGMGWDGTGGVDLARGSQLGVCLQVGGIPVPGIQGLPVRAGTGQTERRVQEVQRIQQPGPHQPDPIHPPRPALSRDRAMHPAASGLLCNRPLSGSK